MPGHAERVAEHDVGGLAADAGQRARGPRAGRHLPAVPLDERGAEADEAASPCCGRTRSAGSAPRARPGRPRRTRRRSGSGANSAGVTSLTRRSVHCADSTVATASSSGVREVQLAVRVGVQHGRARGPSGGPAAPAPAASRRRRRRPPSPRRLRHARRAYGRGPLHRACATAARAARVTRAQGPCRRPTTLASSLTVTATRRARRTTETRTGMDATIAPRTSRARARAGRPRGDRCRPPGRCPRSATELRPPRPRRRCGPTATALQAEEGKRLVLAPRSCRPAWTSSRGPDGGAGGARRPPACAPVLTDARVGAGRHRARAGAARRRHPAAARPRRAVGAAGRPRRRRGPAPGSRPTSPTPRSSCRRTAPRCTRGWARRPASSSPATARRRTLCLTALPLPRPPRASSRPAGSGPRVARGTPGNGTGVAVLSP